MKQIEIDYIVEGDSVILTAVRNLLTPKELEDRHGPIAAFLYGKCRERIHTTKDHNCIIVRPSLFGRRYPDYQQAKSIPFFPFKLTRDQFSLLIKYMHKAGANLEACRKQAKKLAVQVPPNATVKMVKI